MKNLTKPQTLSGPFAYNGVKNNIQEDPTGSYLASIQEGFPPITMMPKKQGGLPPDGKDFNGLGNLLSQFYFYSQNGGLYTFEQEVSDKIGGYPMGAKLWYTDAENNVRLLLSLKDDNTDNFITTPSVIGPNGSWNDVIPTKAFVKDNFLNKNQVTNCLLSVGNKDWITFSGTTATLTADITYSIPNGRTFPGGELNNIITTLSTGEVGNVNVAVDGGWYLLGTENSVSSWFVNDTYTDNYPTPVAGGNFLVYDTAKNSFYTSRNGSDYKEEAYAIIGEYEVVSGSVTTSKLYQPYILAEKSDISRIMYIMNNSQTLSSGFFKFENGLTLQWGWSGWGTSATSRTLTYPISFKTRCVSILTTPATTGGQSFTLIPINGDGVFGLGQQLFRTVDANGVGTNIPFSFFLIGY